MEVVERGLSRRRVASRWAIVSSVHVRWSVPSNCACEARVRSSATAVLSRARSAVSLLCSARRSSRFLSHALSVSCWVTTPRRSFVWKSAAVSATSWRSGSASSSERRSSKRLRSSRCWCCDTRGPLRRSRSPDTVSVRSGTVARPTCRRWSSWYSTTWGQLCRIQERRASRWARAAASACCPSASTPWTVRAVTTLLQSSGAKADTSARVPASRTLSAAVRQLRHQSSTACRWSSEASSAVTTRPCCRYASHAATGSPWRSSSRAAISHVSC